MDGEEILACIVLATIASFVVLVLWVVPKHDEDGWEVKNSACIHVLEDALDQTYAQCNTNIECNAVCAEQRNKK